MVCFPSSFFSFGFLLIGIQGVASRQNQRKLSPEAWELIVFDDFEDGTFGNYIDGGRHARIESKDIFEFESAFQAVVRDDKAPPDSSFFHGNFFDVSKYSDLRVTFFYSSRRMKSSEHQFLVEYATFDGNWLSLKVIDQFEDRSQKEATITFSQSGINVDALTQTKLRFRCLGKDRRTKVYVDNILFEGLMEKIVNEPSSMPSPTPSQISSSTPSNIPSYLPTESPPSLRPTNNRSSSPSMMVTSFPSEYPTDRILTRDDLCPIDRLFPPSKFEIMPYTPPMSTVGVEDDLAEISSLVFTDQTDAQGSLYAYAASDKNQFSLKVLRFNRDPVGGNVVMGSATTVATYALDIHYSNSDWEDISLGPCDMSMPEESKCIYIGDFGNNNRGAPYVQRSVLRILKFPEPIFDGSSPVSSTALPVTVIHFEYTGPGWDSSLKYDAEALFVDWNNGDIYVVTKGKCTMGAVGRIPGSYHASLVIGNSNPASEYLPIGSSIFSIEAVMTNPPKQGDSIQCSDGPFRHWQGADMTRDGRLIALITGASPPRVYFYPRATDQSVVDALSALDGEAASCPYIASTSYGLENERKHEAVAFLPDGKSFADTSECDGGSACNVPIYFWDLVFEDSSNPRSSSPISQWVTLSFDDFESDGHLGSFVAGSRAIPSNAYTCPDDGLNSWSMRINEHKGAESSISYSMDKDASNYSWLKVQFNFLMDGFDHMDSLFLELSLDSGESYFMVADWARGTQGIDHANQISTCYLDEVVVLEASTFGRTTFGSNLRIRFRTSANAANDRVYLDNILVQGHV